MCGRYQFSAEQCEEIQRITEMIDQKYGAGAWQPGEIRPTATAPVLLAGKSGMVPELMSWGYRTAGPLVINARAETAAEKPLFRESLAARRCVVPSTGFFEWDAAKQRFFFTLPGGPALYMAGLWTLRNGFPCYTILTTAANASMQPVHDRMPVVLTHSMLRPWLEDASATVDILHAVPPELHAAAADSDAQLRLW